MVIIKMSTFLSYVYYSITCYLEFSSKYFGKKKGRNAANVRKCKKYLIWIMYTHKNKMKTQWVR